MDSETDKQPPQNDEKDIALLKQKLRAMQLENQLTAELAKNGAQDFETAALVAKARMKTTGTADVKEVVKAVKQDKPFLFAVAAPASVRTQPVKTEIEKTDTRADAAKQAIKSGSRIDVLEYMRSRRGG